MTHTNFLTLSELLNECKQQDKQFYYATQRYTILNAFTKFIQYIELLAKSENKSFKIVSTSVNNIVRIIPSPRFSGLPDKIDEESKTTVLKYCSVIYGDRYYYFSIDDNPFFPHHFAAVSIFNNQIPDYYLDEWQPFASIESAYGQNVSENIQINFEKMLDEFSKIKNRTTLYTKKDKRRPAEIKQTYYINLY